MKKHVTDENSLVRSRFRQTSRQTEASPPLEASEKIRAMTLVHSAESIEINVDGSESARSLSRLGMAPLRALVDAGALQE